MTLESRSGESSTTAAAKHAVIEALAGAWSCQEGDRLILDRRNDLTEDVPQQLLEESARLQAERDREGAAEAKHWAGIARALLTQRAFIASLDDVEQMRRLLAASVDRYDDPFFDLTSSMIEESLRQLQANVESVENGIPSEAASARSVASELGGQCAFFGEIATIADRPDRVAEAHFLEGTRLIWVSRLESATGNEVARKKSDADALEALQRCASCEKASPKIRAQAHANLAALASLSDPSPPSAHLAGAWECAKQAKDRDLLRLMRRNAANEARTRDDLNAVFEYLKGNIDDAEDAIWAVTSPIMARQRIEEIVPDLRSIIDVCLKLGESDPVWFERALEYSEYSKGRPLLRALALIARRSAWTPPRLTRRRAMLLDTIEREGAKLAGQPNLAPVVKPRLDRLQTALAETESAIERTSVSSFALNFQCAPLKYADMQRLLPEGAAAISYYVLPDRTIAFVLNSQGLVGAPLEIPLSEETLIRYCLDLELPIRMRSDYSDFDALQRELDTKIECLWPDNYARYLYEKLVAPLVDRLDRITQLWISPHARLMRVPFHALQNDEGTMLSEIIPVTYTPGLAVLAQCRRKGLTARKTLFAAGTDAGGPALRGTRNEAAAVAALWGVDAQPATLEKVLNEGTRADVVHLACHSDRGTAMTNFQGVLLEDGPLPQQEIATLSFSASMVTLSACETAGGDLLPQAGAECAGLIGAFLRAGCPTVVATMWPVDDRMAEPLMTAFYAELSKPEATPSSALAAAQRSVRAMSAPAFRHPYFIAPFCVWGDSRPSEI